jgi:hypothetical protein
MTEPGLTREQIVTRFTSGPLLLSAALQGLPSAALDLSLAPGEWSIRQIVHHLADDGDAWCMALKKAIATPGALIRLEGFPGNDAWVAALHFDKRDLKAARALIDAHVQVMAQLVADFPAAWENAVTIVDGAGHVLQQVTVGEMIGFSGEHMTEHLETIEAIKHRHGLSAATVNRADITLQKLNGANMDIDLTTPKDKIAWEQMKCPWNEAEGTAQHRCALKNVSICPYFCGVERLDTVLCCYPHR